MYMVKRLPDLAFTSSTFTSNPYSLSSYMPVLVVTIYFSCFCFALFIHIYNTIVKCDSICTCLVGRQEKVEEAYREICKINSDQSQKTCEAIIQKLYNNHVHPPDEYTKPGGYRLYQTDMEKVSSAYRSKDRKGPKVILQLLQLVIAKDFICI